MKPVVALFIGGPLNGQLRPVKETCIRALEFNAKGKWNEFAFEPRSVIYRVFPIPLFDRPFAVALPDMEDPVTREEKAIRALFKDEVAEALLDISLERRL